MSPLGIAHGVLGFGVPLLSVASAWRAGERTGTLAAHGAAVCAALTLGLGLAQQRAWELGARASIASASQSAVSWVDGKQHLGIAAVCFALCASACAGTGDASVLEARTQRVASGLAAGFAMVALVLLAFAHARVPAALVE